MKPTTGITIHAPGADDEYYPLKSWGRDEIEPLATLKKLGRSLADEPTLEPIDSEDLKARRTGTDQALKRAADTSAVLAKFSSLDADEMSLVLALIDLIEFKNQAPNRDSWLLEVIEAMLYEVKAYGAQRAHWELRFGRALHDFVSAYESHAYRLRLAGEMIRTYPGGVMDSAVRDTLHNKWEVK